jgi:hypothetical protein
MSSKCSTDPTLKVLVGAILYLHFFKYRHAPATFCGFFGYIDLRPRLYNYELRTGIRCLAPIQEGEFIQAGVIAGLTEPNRFRVPVLERLNA